MYYALGAILLIIIATFGYIYWVVEFRIEREDDDPTGV